MYTSSRNSPGRIISMLAGSITVAVQQTIDTELSYFTKSA